MYGNVKKIQYQEIFSPYFSMNDISLCLRKKLIYKNNKPLLLHKTTRAPLNIFQFPLLGWIIFKFDIGGQLIQTAFAWMSLAVRWRKMTMLGDSLKLSTKAPSKQCQNFLVREETYSSASQHLPGLSMSLSFEKFIKGVYRKWIKRWGTCPRGQIPCWFCRTELH